MALKTGVSVAKTETSWLCPYQAGVSVAKTEAHLNVQGIFIIELVVIFSPVSMTTRSRDSLGAILDKKIKSF